MKHKSDFLNFSRADSNQCTLFEKCLYIPPNRLHSSECFSGEGKLSFAWDQPPIFAKSQPLAVEFCSGNGQWIAAMAMRSPHLNWIAVERDFDRARKIWLKIFRMNLSNLFVVYGEGFVFSREFLVNASISNVYVNFPDPWPKRRHAKHRIIQKPFVDEMARILAPNGSVTLVTDDIAYSEQMIALFASWKSAFVPSSYITEWPEFGDSFFQSLWMKQHRTIRYHRFIV